VDATAPVDARRTFSEARPAGAALYSARARERIRLALLATQSSRTAKWIVRPCRTWTHRLPLAHSGAACGSVPADPWCYLPRLQFRLASVPLWALS
jgi:hypothetical protein